MNRIIRLFAALALFPLFFLMTAGPCRALDLLVSGAWFLRGSGSMWSSSTPAVASAGGDVLISVMGAGAGEPWKVTADLDSRGMPESARVWVRRGGAGQGIGWIDGGLVFIPLGARDTTLFTGAGDRMQIPLEVKVDGISPLTSSGLFRGELRFKAVSLR
ncbi:MAG: hypothetical protein ACOX5A_04370 [Aminivibrio sp.]|jgi:hypothetical protein|nr:hypothetical protein [Synergistaceae bacterium]